MANEQVDMCDLVLLASLVYLSIDLRLDWDGFSLCKKPVHVWLFVSYLTLIFYRLIYICAIKGSAAGSGHFLLDLRQRSTLLRALASVTWLVIVPLYTAWSVLGTAWVREVLSETPQCMPNEMHFWCLIVWQVLSYAWVLVHGSLGLTAWLLERRVRKAEADLRQVADADTLERWGWVGDLAGYTSVPQKMKEDRLSPAAINALPGVHIRAEAEAGMRAPGGAGGDDEEDCPICLNAVRDGDTVRRLAVCGHVFHRSCVDLWLLRSASCPLCKTAVASPAEGQ